MDSDQTHAAAKIQKNPLSKLKSGFSIDQYLRQGVNRGKRYSRASYRLQITMADTRKAKPPGHQSRQALQQSLLHTVNRNGRDTQKREPPIDCKPQWQKHANKSSKASMAASATAEPPIDCKSRWQRHAKESRAPQGVINPIDCKSQ